MNFKSFLVFQLCHEKWSQSPVFSVAALLMILVPNSLRADVPADLDTAKSNLFAGRTYLVGFPTSKTRNQVRNAYLEVTTNGTPFGSGKFALLQTASSQAVSIRTDSVKARVATQTQLELAQRIAWESQEALLQGQLIAGNANLLKGLRVAFPDPSPNNSFPEKPAGEDSLPKGCPGPANPANGDPDGGYKGSKITDLCYARLHFMRGLISALDFEATDSTGEIRASEPLNSPFIQYASFSTPELPDGNFPTNSKSETMGYLLGNTLDRYGKAVTGIGDRLWRAAYFDRARAPGGSRSGERQQMLDAAITELQKGAHAQFLASLPLAASLSDGISSPVEEFQLCRVDQARVSIANSAIFIDRLRRGEIPKLDSFSLNASTPEINQEINLIKNTLKPNAASKFALARDAIWKVKQSETEMINAAQQLRFQFSDALAAATGIPPGGETDAPYFGLTTKQGRDSYRSDLYQKINDALQAPSTSQFLTDGSGLGQAVLQLQRAFADIASARNRVNTIPQQIRIEEERVGAVNGVILGTTDQITSYQLAIGIANSVQVSVSAGVACGPPYGCGATFSVTETVNPGAIVSAAFQNKITRVQAIQQVQMNNINADATIRNLLLQENQYSLDLESAAIQGQLAVAKVNETLTQIDRLIEDHIYYQDSNAGKWWSDPALVFEQEQEELNYDDAIREYKNELYVLSQKLAARWAEPYQNPYVNRFGVPVTLGSALYDDFTQPESVFNVYSAAKADDFFAGLQTWDLALRSTERLGGDTPGFQARISLRKDIFGFSEVYYDPGLQRFVIDQVARTNDIRLFRALLLRNAQPSSSPFWLRLQFPLSFNQHLRSEEVGGGTGQPFVIPISQNDWNTRITDMSARLIGNNVAQSFNNLFRIELYQYGKIEMPQYFPRNTVSKSLLTFNLPLYYTDPAEGSTSAYNYSLFAGLNGASGLTLSVSDIEPTPYCDNYVLLIERSANTSPINLQNVEDIELTFTLRTGRPAVSTGFAW